jgi:type I restriction enzyme S subunit
MEWRRYSLAEIAPASPAGLEFAPGEDVWHLGLEHIESHTGRVTLKLRAPAEAAGNSTFTFDERNVLYSKLRPYLNKVVVPDEPGIATTELVPLRPRHRLVLREYLGYYLRSPAFLGFASQFVTGAKMPRVIMDKFWGHEVPLPPLSEQRRIVEILDQADRLRRLRAEADAKADRILPALFIKMFGDPLSLAKDPRAKPLSSFQVDLQNGFACGEKDVEDGLPHLRMNNIADSGELDLTLLRRVPRDFDTERYRLRLGDVLFMSTNSEDKVGKACVFDLDASEAYSFSNHLIRIRIEDPDLAPSYLATLFHSLWRVRYFCGIAKRWVNQSTVSKEALGRVPIVAFPKGLQSVFSVAYERYRSLKAQRAAARDALERMFETLLRLAFSAELTASWREAHMKELLQEMEQQARVLEATKA